MGAQAYLIESVYKVVLQESIPERIRRPILHKSNNNGWVDGFVRELTLAKRLYKHFLRDKISYTGCEA